MKTVDDFNFKGKKVLVRVDFNVPVKDNCVTDDTRIRRALPTLKKILNDGGSLILMSHLGRPKDKEPQFSLKQIVPVLEQLLGHKVSFVSGITGAEVQKKVAHLKPGQVLLLENLRYDPREKKGNEDFAKELASLGDFYVNDAFGTAHRAHASTAVIGKFFPQKKAAGYLLANEVKQIGRALKEGEHPVTAIIGGAKVSSKIGVLENLLDKVDNLIIVGGMAYTFLRALGYETADSIAEEEMIPKAKQILDKAREKGVNVILPLDIVIADRFSPDANIRIVSIDQIPAGWQGLDIGPETIRKIRDVILNSKTIIWNGPAGVFEWDKFAQGTNAIGEAVAEATARGSYSIVGGGDSVSAVKKAGLEDKISYISTGGGAMIEMLEGKSLPGIVALEQ